MPHQHQNHEQGALAARDDQNVHGKRADGDRARSVPFEVRNLTEKFLRDSLSPAPGNALRNAATAEGAMPSGASKLPEWEELLTLAAHLQRILPDAGKSGGIVAAIYSLRGFSADAEPLPANLREHYDQVLAEMQSVAGLKTARADPPARTAGSLKGIHAALRQLVREQPLETTEIERFGQRLAIPTLAEMLRIKAVLILQRNATRDYVDFAALFDRLGNEGAVSALHSFDSLYPQPNRESALLQLQIQLASPQPCDLDHVKLAEYRHLPPRWHQWSAVQAACAVCATRIFDRIVGCQEEA
jgi:hypothetical protein